MNLILQMSLALATLTADALPDSIQATQNSMAAQGTCEASWPQLANDIGIGHFTLSRDAQLWLIPCADWSGLNVALGIYVQIAEPSQPSGMITKPQFFVTYSENKGIFADNVVYNVQWDASASRLTAAYNIGQGDCGTRAIYEWSAEQQIFTVRDLEKKDNCQSSEAWTRLLGSTPQGKL